MKILNRKQLYSDVLQNIILHNISYTHKNVQTLRQIVFQSPTVIHKN